MCAPRHVCPKDVSSNRETTPILFGGTVQPGLTLLVRLEALLSSLLNGRLALNDLLALLQDGGPVLENGEGHVLLHTVGDQIQAEVSKLSTCPIHAVDIALPCPFFAKSRSVSAAAERSDTPSPA